MKTDNYFKLGIISRAYSFKGEVILFIDADDPSKYYKLDHIMLKTDDQLVPHFIEKVVVHKHNQIRVKIEGIRSEIDAKSIIKKEVFLPVEDLPKLKDQQFYYHEIESFSVLNAENNELIGTIINIIDHPGNTLLEVDANGTEVLIPLNDNTFEHINKSKKQISINLPEGLLDLYFENE